MSPNDVGISVRDGPFSSDIEIIHLHPPKGTHWVVYKNEKYFDSHGSSPFQKLSKSMIKRIRFCLYSEYKIQGLTSKRDSYCAKCSLFIIYLTNFSGIDFKPAFFVLSNAINTLTFSFKTNVILKNKHCRSVKYIPSTNSSIR